MRISALIFCLLILDACRGVPRAPVPKPTNREQKANNTTPKKDPCAEHKYGICPVDVEPNKNSGDANGVPADKDKDHSPTIVNAWASVATNSTNPMTVTVTVNGQPVNSSKITLSELTLTTNSQANLTTDGTPYTLSLTVNANVSENSTEYCATGQLTADNFEKRKELTVSEGVCQ